MNSDQDNVGLSSSKPLFSAAAGVGPPPLQSETRSHAQSIADYTPFRFKHRLRRSLLHTPIINKTPATVSNISLDPTMSTILLDSTMSTMYLRRSPKLFRYLFSMFLAGCATSYFSTIIDHGGFAR